MSKFIGRYCSQIISRSNDRDKVVNDIISHAKREYTLSGMDLNDLAETLEVRDYCMCGYGESNYSIEEV